MNSFIINNELAIYIAITIIIVAVLELRETITKYAIISVTYIFLLYTALINIIEKGL